MERTKIDETTWNFKMAQKSKMTHSSIIPNVQFTCWTVSLQSVLDFERSITKSVTEQN